MDVLPEGGVILSVLCNPPLKKARRDGRGYEKTPKECSSHERHELGVAPVVWRAGQQPHDCDQCQNYQDRGEHGFDPMDSRMNY